MLLFLQVMK